MRLIIDFVNMLFNDYELDDESMLLRNKLGQEIYDLLIRKKIEITRKNIMLVFNELGGMDFFFFDYVYPNDLIRCDKMDYQRIVIYNVVGMIGSVLTLPLVLLYSLFSIFNPVFNETQLFWGFIPTNYGNLLFIFPIARGILILVTMLLLVKFRKKISSYHQLLITISVSLLASIYGLGMLAYSIIKFMKLRKSFKFNHSLVILLVSVLSFGFTIALNMERNTLIAYDLHDDYAVTAYHEVFNVYLGELIGEDDLIVYLDPQYTSVDITASSDYLYNISVEGNYLLDMDAIDILNNSTVYVTVLVNDIDICDTEAEFLYIDGIEGYNMFDCDKTYEIDGPGFGTINELNEAGFEIQYKLEYTNESYEQVVLTIDCVTINNIYDYQFIRK